MTDSTWRPAAFRLMMIAAAQFVVLTVVAMLVYSGGTADDPTAPRYRFFENFFSELGLTRGYTGEPNTIPLVLWVTSLALAGLGLALFFIAAPGLFRRSRLAFGLSLVGSLFGVASGLSFAGIAFTPADLVLAAHSLFVLAAFSTFLVAVLFYIPAIFLQPAFPKRYAVVLIVFAVALGVYVCLIVYGPDLDSSQGRTIQVVGQKVIVYLAIVASNIMAYGSIKVSLAEVRSPEATGQAA